MKPKVAICVPYYRVIEGDTAMDMMTMAAASISHADIVPIGCTGAYVEDNRNGAVKMALQTGIPFDWLFWIDSDMKFPPDTLVRLLRHDKDIVGANYRQRMPPYGFTAHYADGTDKHILEPGLHRMSHLATGLMLTRFDIYRQMSYPWFTPGIHGQPRDDVAFCNMARAMGYEIWCDHDLTFQVAHTGIQDIEWFKPEQIRPAPMIGAELSQLASDRLGDERAKKAGEEYLRVTGGNLGQARPNGDSFPW
jgi:hypothetical protein